MRGYKLTVTEIIPPPAGRYDGEVIHTEVFTSSLKAIQEQMRWDNEGFYETQLVQVTISDDTITYPKAHTENN